MIMSALIFSLLDFSSPLRTVRSYRGTRFSFDTSIPSRIMANSLARNSTRRAPSRGRGSLNLPSSKRLYHNNGLTRQPDPRFLRAVHRLQTRQPDHDAVSTTASNARTCSASNPRPTSRLRPFCNRISTRESPAAFGADSVSCTSRNFTAVSLRNRFFHAKKYGLHRPRSRQNAVTVCPLRACSEISLRHFVRAFFPRCHVATLHCDTIFYKMGFA